jgi:hypothetical protein
VKDKDAHLRTTHHYFCYEGIKAGFKHAMYYGFTKYVDSKPEEIQQLVDENFDFKKWQGKDLFTPAVRVQKTVTVAKAKKVEPVVEENNDIDTHTDEINLVIKKITEIIDEEHKDQFEDLLKLPDDINKYNMLDELLLVLLEL